MLPDEEGHPDDPPEEFEHFTALLFYLTGLEPGTKLQIVPPDTKKCNVGKIKRIAFESGPEGEEPTRYEVAWVEIPHKLAPQVLTDKEVQSYVHDYLKVSGASTVAEITDSWNLLSTGRVRRALDSLRGEEKAKFIRGGRFVATGE